MATLIKIRIGFELLLIIASICWLIIYFIFYGTRISYKYKKHISLDDVSNEFENLYKNLFDKHINSLNSLRNKLLLMSISLFVGIVILVISKDYKFVGIIFAIISSVKIVKYREEYIKLYKSEIIPNFIKLLNDKLEYKTIDRADSTLKNNWQKAYFDSHNKKEYEYYNYYLKDYILGNFDNDIIMKIWDLDILMGALITRKHKIFEGLFVQIKNNKNINGYIKICRNIIKNKLRMLNQNNKVETNNVEFERIFNVYSDNKIIAKQLLTNKVMQDLIEFYNKYKIDYEIVFRKKDIYIRLFIGAMFEPKVFKRPMDKKQLFTDFCVLELIIEMTKKINKFSENIEI